MSAEDSLYNSFTSSRSNYLIICVHNLCSVCYWTWPTSKMSNLSVFIFAHWNETEHKINIYGIGIALLALHCIALHCIALHCIALHCIVSHHIERAM